MGWNWANKLTQAGHEVWVITHEVSRANIERHLQANPSANLHFVYHRVRCVPDVIGRTHAGYYLQCFLWQLGAYRIAKRLHQAFGFSCVHHVTFMCVRYPSYMGLLGVPFIFGPVAGGERPTWPLIMGFPLKRWPRELIRLLSNNWIRFDPILRWVTLSRAARIVVSSKETLELLPQRFRQKTTVQLNIAFDPPAEAVAERCSRRDKPLHVLYAGQLLYWKGIHLGLRAFAQFLKEFPDSRFTIVGNGPDRDWLHSIADSLALGGAVEWVPWMDRSELLDTYHKFDVFMFPSTRDSGGMVVLESMANGLPVISLDLGGPALIVNNDCGRRVRTLGLSEPAVVDAIAVALREVADQDFLRRLRAAAISRAQEFTWEEHIHRIYANVVPDDNGAAFSEQSNVPQ